MDEALAKRQRRQRLVALAIFGALGGGLAYRMLSGTHPTPASPTSLSALVFLDRREDDGLRSSTFRAAIGQSRRCDAVESMLMERPGQWRVACSPGYRFRLAFVEAPGGGRLSVAQLP